MTGSEKAYYEKYVRPSLKTFIIYRFEEIARPYFRNLKRNDVVTIGTYWYDIRKEKTNGEFDVAMET